MLSLAARRAPILARLSKVAAPSGKRALSSLYGGSDKERAEELAYFRKQEQVGFGRLDPGVRARRDGEGARSAICVASGRDVSFASTHPL